LAFDRLMQFKLSTPEIFIAEGIKAEDLFAFPNQIWCLPGFCLQAGSRKQDYNQEQTSRIQQRLV
jgi:hypothetical protein